MRAIEAAQTDTELVRLASALGIGTPQSVEQAIAWQTLEDQLQKALMGTIVDVAGQAGTSAASQFDMTFSMVNPRAVAWADSHVGDLITVISDESKLAIREIIRSGIFEGHTVDESAREIRGYIGLNQKQAIALANYAKELEAEAGEGAGLSKARLDKMRAYADELIRDRADMISRTETIDSLNSGQRLAWQDAADEGLLDPETTRRMWIASEDACEEICLPLNRTTVAFDEDFDEGDPPAHPNCLPGNTLISTCGPISATTERGYYGDFVVIRTSRGYELSCTPNHPIFTDHGFVAAGELNEGSNVACCVKADLELFPENDGYYMPATIHHIAETFGGAKHVSSAKVPISSEDFHGDGKGSQIAIIRANRLLRDSLDSATQEQIGKVGFIDGNILAVAGMSLPKQRRFALLLKAYLATFGRLMCGKNLMRSLLIAHGLPFDGLGFALTSTLDSIVKQNSFDNRTTNSEEYGALLLRDSREVILDKIVYINKFNFHGHVYNLQTKYGIYAANGIITHNCRCTTGLVFNESHALIASYTETQMLPQPQQEQ